MPLPIRFIALTSDTACLEFFTFCTLALLVYLFQREAVSLKDIDENVCDPLATVPTTVELPQSLGTQTERQSHDLLLWELKGPRYYGA